MPSATAQARSRAPLILPPPTAGSDPAALAAWLAGLPPGARLELERRLAGIAAGMPAVWQLAVARAAAATGRPPDFPLPKADLGAGIGDFSFASLALALVSAGASVGTAAFANKEQKDLASETSASTNASNSALATASAQAKTAVAAALAAATKQAGAAVPTAAGGAASTPSTASPLRTLLIVGLGGVLGLLLLHAALTRSTPSPKPS